MTTSVKPWRFPGVLAALLGSCEETAQADEATTLGSLRRGLEALRQRTQVLEQKLLGLESSRTAQPPAAVPAPGTPASAASGPPSLTPRSPTEPITGARAGQAYLNLSFGALITAGGFTSADGQTHVGLEEAFLLLSSGSTTAPRLWRPQTNSQATRSSPAPSISPGSWISTQPTEPEARANFPAETGRCNPFY